MALTCTNVTLRQRVISNGRISLYLDYYPAIRNPYTMKMSRREYLGIYIYARPKNEIERDFNNEMLSKAEAIRCIRVQAIVNEEFGFLDKHKMKADFLAYFREKAKLKYHKWDCVYQHFEKFVNGYCTFGDVTVELCQKFRQYLLNCKQIRHPNISVSRNSAAGYFSTFRALLKIAYQEKMLRENLNDFIDKIEWKEVKKQYLTLAEVKKLAATPCKIPVLKQASLFSCMTGLRISDILQLTWDNIEVGPDNSIDCKLSQRITLGLFSYFFLSDTIFLFSASERLLTSASKTHITKTSSSRSSFIFLSIFSILLFSNKRGEIEYL